MHFSTEMYVFSYISIIQIAISFAFKMYNYLNFFEHFIAYHVLTIIKYLFYTFTYILESTIIILFWSCNLKLLKLKVQIETELCKLNCYYESFSFWVMFIFSKTSTDQCRIFLIKPDSHESKCHWTQKNTMDVWVCHPIWNDNVKSSILTMGCNNSTAGFRDMSNIVDKCLQRSKSFVVQDH